MRFNPRPDRAAGATWPERANSRPRQVSIRAPTVRPGRHQNRVDILITTSFNPRPDRAAGATSDANLPRDVDFVSIRAPTVRPGRPPTDETKGAPTRVSIRAPTVRPGRHRVSASVLLIPLFQSAPRPCGRGDYSNRVERVQRSGFNPRPDRAAGATSGKTSSTLNASVSIRAPTVRPGRPASSGQRLA